LAAAILAILFGIDYYGHRFVRSNQDMLRLLPQADMTSFFANIEALRRAGMLNLLAGPKQAADKEYRDFVRQTHFDYTKNIDQIAGAADGNQLFFIVRGHFDWRKLREYSVSHHGACTGELCNVPTSTRGRWASFVAIQHNVLGLAVSANGSAAETLRPPAHRRAEAMPGQPVWVKPSHALLRNPLALPLPLRIFAISLQSADVVVLALAPAPENSRAAFNLELTVECPSRATAETIRSQLEIQTSMLRRELAREHQQPNPADLTGLLTNGSFQVAAKTVTGTWPVRKEFVKTLE
jgi:hypothetical protein